MAPARRKRKPGPPAGLLEDQLRNPEPPVLVERLARVEGVDAQQATVDYGSLKAKFQGTDGKAAAAGEKDYGEIV